MKTPLTLLALLAATLSTAALAHADGEGPRPGHGKDRAAIHKAMAEGLLTQSELATLKTERAALHAKAQGFRADGKIDDTEKAELKRDRDALRAHAQELIANAERGEPIAVPPRLREDRAAIRKAMAEGLLTQTELATLKAEGAALHAKAQGFRADGKIDETEKAELKRDRDALQAHAKELIANAERGEPIKPHGRFPKG